jgi:hypothetical protein|tara:strand:- start:74 stop:2881 length:2808 start_codon:yes stop_codon:yes gene_type:complete
MTAVSQLLPNFIQGINEQPDELKKPGQIRDAVNVYPDVTKGLRKRTGYDKIGNVINTDTGCWFFTSRRAGTVQKRYLFHVSTDGFVRGWDADTGTSQTVLRSETPVDLGLGDEEFDNISTLTMSDIEYLTNDLDYGIKSATLADTTFLCNTNQVTSMSSSSEGVRPYESFIEFKVIDVERAYQINFDRIGNGTNTTSQASDIEEVRKFKFFSGGRTSTSSNCPATGSHTLTSNGATNEKYDTDPNDNGTRAGEIQVRVTIASQPKILSNSGDYSCEYYVSQVRLLSGGEGWKLGDTFRVDLPGTYGDGNETMGILYEVTEVLTSSGPVDVANISITPTATNNSVQSLQNLLADEIIARVSVFDSNFGESNIEIIGNGIYISDSLPFKIDTSEPDLLSVITNQSELDEDWEAKREVEKATFLDNNPLLSVADFDAAYPELIFQYPNPVAVVNNVSKLPLECKQGFVAKVANSFVEDDDYFVEFVRDYGDVVTDNPSSTTRYVESGMGYWKEIAKPGERATINTSTMPHVLRYRATTDDWVVANVKYAKRTCGTEDQFTPSFIDQKINNMLFYRNRLVLLSGSSVVTSNAGDFTNFFPSTALTVSPSDPVDVESTSNYTANLFAGIEINNALLVFGEYNQFLLTTDSDIFSPNTAKLSQVSAYKFDTNSEPFIIGTNVGFVGNTNNTSSMYEMTNIFREGQTDVIEKSKLVSNTFSSDYSMTSSSKETGLVTFGKKGSDIVWLYKYFKENSQSDIQQAWFKWKLPDDVYFQCIDDNKHYAVIDGGILLRNDLEANLDSVSVYQDDGVDFEMKIVLPTFYVLKNEQQAFRADTTASLVIHRMHLNTGESDFYDITIERYAKDPYTIARDPSVMRYEQAIADAYIADAAPITLLREETVPLYEKNTNLDITITSTFNGPFTLYSLRWEGDYNNRYYQRV